MTALVVSVGPGPVEARRFVAMLARTLRCRLPVTGDARVVGDPASPSRVELSIDAEAYAEATPLLGTHVLLAPLRGPRARARWYASVHWHGELATSVLHARDVRCSFMRSRGPGGQNVNKRATAVRLEHLPSGLVVSCDTHRSQARNRSAAWQRLQDQLATAHAESQRRCRTGQWSRLRVRDAVVMRWRLHPTRANTLIRAMGDGDAA